MKGVTIGITSMIDTIGTTSMIDTIKRTILVCSLYTLSLLSLLVCQTWNFGRFIPQHADFPAPYSTNLNPKPHNPQKESGT